MLTTLSIAPLFIKLLSEFLNPNTIERKLSKVIIKQSYKKFYLYGKTIPEIYEMDAEGNQGILNKQLALTFRHV